MSMRVTFAGEKRVEAAYKGFTIRTDQPAEAGGANSAPSPFDLFLASLGTCAGFYVLAFCQRRGIPTEGITLMLDAVHDAVSHVVTRVDITVLLPADFPAESIDACVRAADQCAVRRHLQNPPQVHVTAHREAARAAEL